MAARVFDVPELLEMVLLKLHPRDVFIAVRVCRRLFRDVVDRSVQLPGHILLACNSGLSKVRFRTPIKPGKGFRLKCSTSPAPRGLFRPEPNAVHNYPINAAKDPDLFLVKN
ncbi:hypothetical protein Tdes44962_MAKER01217 [Teratosphaeria destructans]|uniref:F-box domain-containing protein n=1 Tax=Teratosphaeria destructans TaxID=418781 RepID=A0A9W7T2L9_9PEZI|nr:hypothetical protein Tdes44962_MAKER01217 [Teratosphaeria destructans]